MLIQLVVKKTNEQDQKFPFNLSENGEITIGRDDSNQLHLLDPNRLVGRKHAIIRRQADVIQLLDLESKNFTFIDDIKLNPHQPYVLNKGDQFKIGNFIIEVAEIHLEEPDDRTRFDFSIQNPFLEYADELANVLKKAKLKYESESARLRDDQLIEALNKSFAEIESDPVNVIIANRLNPSHTTSPSGPIPLEYLKIVSEKTDISKRIEILFHSLLQAIISFIKMPWNFRLEFIEMTIAEKVGSFSIHKCTEEQLKAFLLSDKISEDEFNKRHTILKEAFQDVLIHQIAILDGYKRSTIDGTKKLLQEINPTEILKTFEKEGLKVGSINMKRLFRSLFYGKLWQIFCHKYSELLAEDRGIFEKKMFRPGFISAYLERISSGHNED